MTTSPCIGCGRETPPGPRGGTRAYCVECIAEREALRKHPQPADPRQKKADKATAGRAWRIRNGRQAKVRLCGCGAPVRSPKSPYCDMCKRAAEAKRPRKRPAHQKSSTARGYGNNHQKLRRQWTPRVDRGDVACWRCGRLILPGTPWDLGHDDFDRTVTRGPEHSRCNRATSGRRPR